MLNRFCTTSVAASLLMTVTHAVADEQSIAPEIEVVTVTASTVPVPLAYMGVSVTVFGREELNRLKPAGIGEVLRTVPGVNATSSGGLGSQTSVFIRGEGGFRTQLWIDGINISDPSTPQVTPRFDALLGGRWQRLEVLRGPQGLAYGADAGGVINLFSPVSEQPFAADVQMQAGGYNSQQLDANARGQSGKLGYFISGSHIASRGFNARVSDRSGEFDGVSNTTLHNKFSYKLSRRQSIELVHRHVEQTSEYDQCFTAEAMTHDCRSDQSQWSGRAAWIYESRNGQHQLALSENHFEQADLAGQEHVADKEGSVRNWRYSGYYQFGEPLTLAWGGNYETEAFTDWQWNNEGERSQMGVYFEGLVSVTDFLHYTIAARFDDSEEYGEHSTYRFSSAYLIPTSAGIIKLKGAYGTAFRIPSLFEQSLTATGVTLNEESSHGGEAGIEWLGDIAALGATLFQTKTEDRIVYDDGYRGYVQVMGPSSSKGLELNASLALGVHVTLAGNYTFNETRIDHRVEDNPRWRQPQNSYYAALRTQWLNDAWQLDVAMRGVRNAQEDELALDDYDVASLISRYRINDYWSVHIKVDNITDEIYQEALGFHTSRRKAYLGTEFSF